MKVLNLVLAALFLVFAFLQLDDPDAVIWILAYGLMAVACILAAFRYFVPAAWRVLTIALFACSFLYIDGVIVWMQSDEKHLLFDDLAKMQYLWVEQAREYLGLMICVVVLVIHLLQYRALKRRYAVHK